MRGAERCDEIVKLIDQVLADLAAGAPSARASREPVLVPRDRRTSVREGVSA